MNALYSYVCAAACQNLLFLTLLQVRYNSKSSMLYAASRDRVVYGWRWPKESPNSLHNSFTAEALQETTKRLERHTLGVTALACSECKQLSAVITYCS